MRLHRSRANSFLVPGRLDHRTRVGVEGHRWAIKDGFAMAESELGLDHNETRS